MSVDGVFDAANMNKWFFPFDSRFIKKTYESADALLMGRVTYEMLAPYRSPLSDDQQDGLAGTLKNKPKFIASSGSKVADWGDTTLISDNVEEAVKELKSKIGNIIIGSAKLAESLAKASLIDEYKLLVTPVIAGNGRHFFSEEMKTQMELDKFDTLDQNTLLLNYKVLK